jgi:hypothetical protein
MIYFNASNPSAPGTEYYDVIIEDEPLLTDCGFTKFSLPLNGNATKMILYNDKLKSMITYVDFNKHNTIDKTVNLLREKLRNEQMIEDDKVVETLCSYLRNACVLLSEDPEVEFFKNCNDNGDRRNGNGNGNKHNESSELELELTSELKQAGIVNRFVFYTKTNAIQVLLSHHYNRKSIVFSVDKRDWNKTHSIFEKQLKQKGISKEHILQLSDVLDNNYKAILSLGGLDPESADSETSDKKQEQQRKSAVVAAAAIAALAEEDDDNTTNITDTGIIDPSKDLDPYIPDRDYAEFAIKTAKKTVKQEDSLVRQILYTGISKDSANPQNLAILAPTSEGKTHAALETLEYFPQSDLWKLGSMSPKVIIRQNGILVNNKYESIEAQLKELKKQIRACRKEGADEQAEELEEQKHQLLQEAKVMIDLRGKLLVFLEPPHPETWNILKPILSHDSHYIEHPYVYKVEDFGFIVKKIVTRGCLLAYFVVQEMNQNGRNGLKFKAGS